MHVRRLLQCGALGPVAILCAAAAAWGEVQPLPLPPDVEPSRVYRVFVNDQEVPVGVEQPARRPVEAVTFQFTGQADVRIIVNEAFDSCMIRPLRFGLTEAATISSGEGALQEIRFSLDKPQHLVIDIDDLPHLALISSPPDDDLPDPDDPNVIYFGPGVHEPGRIRVQSNQTVYLAAGAKVYGTIEGTCVENVRVTGRGRLYGTKHTDWNKRTYGIIFDRSRNITVEKIGIRDCYWWTTKFLLCDDVVIRDISLITFNRNNGGLMIDSCRNLLARDSLLMSRDDCICPHALNAAGNGEVVSKDMHFGNLVLYNFYDGNGIRIGASFETSEVRNWTFRDIDVVHRAGAAIYSDHSDWASVRNLVLENFNDEVSGKNSIDMRIAKTRYSCETGYRDDRGRFDGLFFINVRSAGGRFVFKGFDQGHAFDNVVFADCWIGDQSVRDLADIEVNEFVRGVQFLVSADDVAIPPLPPLTPEDENAGVASPAKVVIDDGDKSFRSYGFTRQTGDDVYQGAASIGQVIDKFGQYAAAIYEPRITGRYNVYAYWGAYSGMDSKSSWIIRHCRGYSRAYLDQNDNAGWHHLGAFDLDGDSNVRLVYPNYFEPTRRPVVADAVRFVRVDQGATVDEDDNSIRQPLRSSASE